MFSSSPQSPIKVKRIYESPCPKDGCRVLVDRLWPRGIKKEEAQIDMWLKAIAPSTELRNWFQHDPDKWSAFQKRYGKELETKEEQLAWLRQKRQQGTLTLLYAAKNETYNHALILKDHLMK